MKKERIFGKVAIGILLLTIAILPIASATNDSENFGIQLPVDYTASSQPSQSDTEHFGLSLPIDYTASPSPSQSDTESFGIALPIDYTPSSQNQPPTIQLNSPSNGATNVDINVSLSVTVSDPDGDLMTITFWHMGADIWESWGQLTNKTNGTYSFNVSGLSYNTTYLWKATVNDSTTTTSSEEWTFTTIAQNETPNQPPVANFTWTADGLTVSFNDTSTDSDGSIVAWAWIFGDGSFSLLQNPSHTYSEDGTYNVTLIVKDNNNATDSISEEVTVSSGGGGGWISDNFYDYFWYFIIILVFLFVMVFIGIIGMKRG